METRKSWGIVYVAAAFAVLAVLVALIISYLDRKHNEAVVVAVSQNLADWHSLANTVGTTSASQAPVAEAVSNDLYNGYSALLNQGTFTAKERDQMLAGIVQKNITPPAIVPNINLVDLNIATGTPVGTYLQLLNVILAQSSQVHQYEVNVFAQTVTNDVTAGTPELAQDAILYEKIGTAILLMQVPPALATQHLEVVKSVGALAKAVANMSQWSGDPIQALVYMDSFNKAEAYVTNSMNNLLAAATVELKKKS